MRFQAALRRSNNPITAGDEFESAKIDDSSSTTIDIRSHSIGSSQTDKKFVNLALASILTLTPVAFLGPIDLTFRRQGAASLAIYDLLDIDDDLDDSFLFPGGLIIPNPNRNILFRKILKLEGLEKRKPYLNV